MVSRAEFQSALDAAKLPVLCLMERAPAHFQPNVEVSKAAGEGLSVLQDWSGRLARRFGFPDLAPYSEAANAAVAAARDSLERRLARALQSARVLEGDSRDLCIAGMHALLDAHGYPRQDRFGVLPAAVWDRMLRGEPEFAATLEVWPSARLWGDMIWLRSRQLEEVQAVMLHRRAIEGRIEPLDPSPGQGASAEVTVRVVDPEGLRVLRWPISSKT